MSGVEMHLLKMYLRRCAAVVVTTEYFGTWDLFGVKVERV